MIRTARSAACCIGLLALAANSSWAATITVAPGAVVVAADGLCSLREAINNANADAQVDNSDCLAGSAGNDVLELAADSLYIIPDVYFGATGLPSVVTAIELAGNGATLRRNLALDCTIDGIRSASEFRLLRVDTQGVLQVNDLSLGRHQDTHNPPLS